MKPKNLALDLGSKQQTDIQEHLSRRFIQLLSSLRPPQQLVRLAASTNSIGPPAESLLKLSFLRLGTAY